MANTIKVTGGFISTNEPNPYERKTKEGLIIPGEFEEEVKKNERAGPVTSEGLTIPATFIDNRKSPEEKQYLIFYSAFDDERDTYQTWEVCTGRTETYRFIKRMVDCIDFTNSFVLVEGVSLEDSVTLYDFAKHIKQYYDDAFDIDDHTNMDMSTLGEDNDEELSPDKQLATTIFGNDHIQKNNEAINIYNTVMNGGFNSMNMIQNMILPSEEESDSKNI